MLFFPHLIWKTPRRPQAAAEGRLFYNAVLPASEVMMMVTRSDPNITRKSSDRQAVNNKVRCDRKRGYPHRLVGKHRVGEFRKLELANKRVPFYRLG